MDSMEWSRINKFNGKIVKEREIKTINSKLILEWNLP